MSMIAVLVAVALDASLREPPLRVHPVRAMGGMLDALGQRTATSPARRAVVGGAIAWTAGVVTTAAVASTVNHVCGRLPAPAAGVAQGVALWPLVSLAMLADEVVAVEHALESDLDSGRMTAARLVSRDLRHADETQVRTAAIASLAENLSDGLVAPLLWFALGGLPAAAVYRYINTADAMWGYRDDRWRHAGRVAARADDLANLLPARLTGMTLTLPCARLHDLRSEAARTTSPNAGWPMAAVALRLGIRIDKPGIYHLNAQGRPAQAADTARALRLVRRRGLALAALLGFASTLRYAPCRR